MNNEPVAWMDNYGNICLDIDKKMNQGKITARNNYDANDIPLYIHPAKKLTDEEYDNIFANGKRLGVLETEDRFRNAMNLTDKEIAKLFYETFNLQYTLFEDGLKFARAILRKAQEK